VQVLLDLVKGSARRRRSCPSTGTASRHYYAHLSASGLTEEDLVAYALVLGRRQD
jgi:hypothetical protein